MPYIKQQAKDRLAESMFTEIRTCGELNYCITMLIQDYLTEHPGYKEYNEAIGVLECAKLELYRRRVAILEDQKIKENGDVY